MHTLETGFFLALLAATASAQTRLWEKNSAIPRYGERLDNAGDVDGDGHDDYLVAANTSGDGQIWVISGKTDLVLFTKTGGTGHRLGTSVAGAGDLNADGFADVVAGAPGRGASGFVYVFAGPGGQEVLTIDAAALGYTPGANFGSNVNRAGDINADGFGDFITGTPDHGSAGGSVQVYSGRDNTILVNLGGTFAGNRVGAAVCSAGDVDGDGFDDYAYAETVTPLTTWTATIRSGSTGATITRLPNLLAALVTVPPRMSDLGDVNGDGSHDLAVILGIPLSLGIYSASTGALLHSHVAFCAAAAGDVNGDGCGDVIVGTRPPPGGDASVTLISGKNGYPLTRVWRSYAGFAEAVCAVDLDCDGHTEFLVGSPQPGGGIRSAYAIDLLGEHRLAGDAPGANFGITLAEAGDVNNDGIPDVIVGQWTDPTGVGGGSARILSGADFSTIRRLYATGPNDLFGAVAGVGDVNADGYDDVAVGAHVADANGVDSGSVVVFSGADGTAIHTIAGDSPGANMGAVAGLGDWDGDGVRDFWVGSSGADYGGADSGSVYVFSGRTGAQLHRFDGDGAGDNFGIVVANAGDVDNDGVDDLIAGAPGDDDNGADCGMMRVLSGANGSILHTIYGLSAGDRFGHPVGAAGDIDNDGHADLIGSGQVYTAGAGYVRVHSGRTGAVLQGFNGSSPGSRTGDRVGTIGDIDGDGHDDYFVGAPGHDSTNMFGNGTDAGAIWVISGRDGSIHWTFLGDAAGDALANLSRLGDVNNDGEPELVVGAWNVDANGINSGALTIYLSNGRRPGKFSTYGAGCLGTNGTMPSIGAANRPIVGQTFTVTHRTAAPAVASALHLGTSPQAIDLGLIGFIGCTALTLPTFVFPGTTDQVGRGSRSLPIPNRASMIDASLYGQWYFLEFPAAVLSTSNGGKITFGGS